LRKLFLLVLALGSFASHAHARRVIVVSVDGFRPDFLMVGPRVRLRTRVPHLRQIDIAPTIAYWAGWELPGVDGMALRGLFEEETR
jgi:hypothetical protein